MARDVRTITIDSIFGGQATFDHFPNKDQYYASLGVDPEPDGILNPKSNPTFNGGSNLKGAPLWIRNAAKTTSVFIYDSAGSVCTANQNTISGLGDLNDAGSASGNGCEYYDNYMYFARDTTVARYGPLNGEPTFTDDYWVGTLSKTALVNTQYPVTFDSQIEYPNHFLKRGKDGRLYIADVVGNQGTIHYIKTTKSTVEGDTDDGSTYNALDLPYGYFPVSMEWYGDNYLAIACAVVVPNTQGVSQSDTLKVVLWDTTNTTTYDRIIDFEFSDKFVAGLKNINGVLYLISGYIEIGSGNAFLRVSRYVGGHSFEQVAVTKSSNLPLSGAIDGDVNRLVFSGEDKEFIYGSVYGVGMSRQNIGNSLYNIQNTTSSTTAYITSIINLGERYIIGWGNSNGYGLSGSNTYPSSESYIPYNYISFGPFKVGQKFKVTKVTINFENPLASSYGGSISLYLRPDSLDEVAGNTAVNTISYTNYPSQSRVITHCSSVGEQYFMLDILWNEAIGSFEHPSILLPITIEYEIIDD